MRFRFTESELGSFDYVYSVAVRQEPQRFRFAEVELRQSGRGLYVLDYFRDCSHHYSGTFFMEKAGDGTMGNNYLSCDKPDIFFQRVYVL